METSPNISKHSKDASRSQCSTPGQDACCNKDPNANWGTEPNFNLNQTSPRNPRPPNETPKLHGGTRTGGGKPGVKVAGNAEMDKWSSTVKTTLLSPGEKDSPSQQKSRIPASSRSPTTERMVNSRVEQKLKSPNPKQTPTLSTKVLPHSSMAVSPKPQRQEQTAMAVSPTAAERRQTHGADAKLQPANGKTSRSVHKVPGQRKEDGLETLHVPLNPNAHSQKTTSPKPANRTPTLGGKLHKPEPASASVRSHQQVSRDSKASLSTKTPQQSSVSPKPATQRKVAGTRKSNTSVSKGNSKDSSAATASKSISRSSSNSKATGETMDSLDSQSESHSKATQGSRDSLESKSGSASKTSWGSKDSLDSKAGSDSTCAPESKDDLGHKPPSASLNLKPSSESNVGTSSVVLSGSKPIMAPKPALLVSDFDSDHVASPLSSGCNVIKPTSSSSTSSPEPRAEQNFSKFRAAPSTSAVSELSFSLGLSPRPGTASRGLGLGSVPSGPSKGILRSPGSAPGCGVSHLLPLATSSPKTTWTTKGGGTQQPNTSVTVETNSSTFHNTGLTRGLTFDSISKTTTDVAAAVKQNHVNFPDTTVTAVRGSAPSQGSLADRGSAPSQGSLADRGSAPSQGSLADRGSAPSQGSLPDRFVCSPKNTIMVAGSPSSKPDHLGGRNAASIIPSFREVGVGRERSSSPLHPPALQSTHPSKPKRVREPASTMDTSGTRDVGVQVEASSLSGSPGSQTSPTAPSLCCVPAGQPPFQHVCRIDIELSNELAPPALVTSSLPAGLRTHSFQQSPALASDQNRGVSAASISQEQEAKQDSGEGEIARKQHREKAAKPQDVARDEQGMTWEVYGAAVDPETLSAAVQSHLESKIRQQAKHIRTLRKSIRTIRLRRRRKKKKKKKKKSGGILGCCRKALLA